MTSKEAFKKICKNLNSYEFADEFKQIKKQIIKDLEVLDILRYNLFVENGTGRWKGFSVISCSLGSEHSGNNFKIVKEWLENEI